MWNEEMEGLNPKINIDTFENNPESNTVEALQEI